MRFSTLVASSFVLVPALAGCRTTNTDNSDAKTIRETQTSITDASPILSFVQSSKGIIASQGHAGEIPAKQFIAMIPLGAADRQNINAAYPGNFAVTCQAGFCSAVANGSEVEGTLLGSVKVNFFVTITNPTLSVADQITADFVLRGDQGVEFCNVSGMQVSKLGVVQTIFGLYNRVENGTPKLAVADEPGDYTCEN